MIIYYFMCIFRCFSALGDIAKARYMKETFRLAEEISRTKVSLQLLEVEKLTILVVVIDLSLGTWMES